MNRTACWSPVHALCILSVAIVTLGGAGAASARTSWHHGNSPYRAAFKVIRPPSQPQSGVAVTVPVCGLAGKDFRDLYAYDENGNQLRLHLVGKGARNTVLALVDGTRPFKEVYVYFGSGGRAPMVEKGVMAGLTCDVRTLPEGEARNWPEVEVLLRKSRRLGMSFVDHIEQPVNPVDATPACILVFDGHLSIPRKGTYTYMMVTDDAGYLFIDDQLVLSRDGRHWARDAVRGESRVEVELTPGPHKVRMVVVDFGGELMAVLGRWIDGRNKYVLPPDAFVRSGATRLLSVESHYDDAPMPLFTYEALSYMSIDGAQFTEMRFEAANGKESLWRFEDGARLTGSSCVRILPGMESRGIACTQRRVTAQGLIQFSEIPPKQRLMDNAADFEHYSKLILEQDLGDLDPGTLRGYVTFLQYRPLNPAVIPVCDAIAANRDASDSVRLAALVDLALVAAAPDPEKARKAHEVLLDQKRDGDWIDYARNAADFALFRVRDFAWADAIIRRLQDHASRDGKIALGLRFDLALQQGEVDQAREYLEELLAGRELGRRQRFAAVQGNALRERYYDLLNEGFVLEARDVLREWTETAPMDRTNGSLSLARARMWRTLGWLDGALSELEGAMLLDPLLPNLPDVELERAKILAQAGGRDKANSLLLEIINNYPNHPAADEAKGLLR